MSYAMMLSIASLFYILILMIIFLTRKKINNSETKIYSILIFIIIIEIGFELLMRLIAPYMDTLKFLNIFVAKLFSYLSLLWFSLITLYNLNISFKNNDALLYKKSYKYLIAFLSIAFIFIFALPVKFYFPKNTSYYTYTYGPSVYIAFVLFFILMLVNILVIIKNGKQKFSKKYFPIIASIIFFTIGGIVQKINPTILLNLFGQSLVTFLMYHTIENPDIKMLDVFAEFTLKVVRDISAGLLQDDGLTNPLLNISVNDSDAVVGTEPGRDNALEVAGAELLIVHTDNHRRLLSLVRARRQNHKE